jgi:hypothetical protein
MKKILIAPDLNRYLIGDHLEYNTVMYQTGINFLTGTNVKPLLPPYQIAVEQETHNYKWIRKSELTKKKAEIDHERDAVFIGMREVVRANRRSFDPLVRDSALHVINLLENYGRVTNSGYDAETAAIDSILAHLESSNYQDAVIALNISPYMKKLTEWNELFKTLAQETTVKLLTKPDITFKETRRQTDEALKAITDRVVAEIIINGMLQPFDDFIREFNITTEHYNTLVHEHYGRLHARTDIAGALIENIKPEHYTGKPIYVIPSLVLTITEKDGTKKHSSLVFSVDFTVAYQNNVNPGTATLIITGMGKYAGEIITTFNIVDK